MKKFIIFLFIPIILLLSIFTKNLINQSKNVVYVPSKMEINPLIETSLKDVVFLDWNKSLLDIAEIFANGEMNRKSPKENILANYRIDAKLMDIDESVKLTFHQNEEFIRGDSQTNTSIRNITFIAQSPDEQRKKFNSICDFINSFKQRIFPIKNQNSYDVSYNIYNSDNSGGTSISVKMETNKNNPIYLTITPFKISGIKGKS